jgi:ribosomal protein S18 acetylase RimI-like enzyme
MRQCDPLMTILPERISKKETQDMDITYRNARKTDCLQMAEMITLASGGVVEFLFHNLMPELTPVQIVSHNMENSQGSHTYKNAIVAESDDRVAGMALSFPSHFHEITAEMKQVFPPDRLEHLSDFYAARVEDSFFLDALCVDQQLRKNGIGGKLISLTKKKAKQTGFDTLSLVVFADNTAALSVYHAHGFEIVAPVELNFHERIPHKGGCFLMKSRIDD